MPHAADPAAPGHDGLSRSRGRGDTRGALAELRRAEKLFRGSVSEQERVRKTIAAMRASAPDSLRALFAADSAASASAKP